MSSSHRGSASSSRQRGRNVSNETRTRSTDRFKWTYEQEKKLIELFDHAISMNKYTLKDPTALGRDYIVEQFNLAFNKNITYGFFKNKLDEFKKSYKMWKFLMKSTDLIMEMTNQPERIQLMFNMDFRWTIIMKFQIVQQKELRLIPNNHNHPVLVSQVVLILDKIHDNPEQEAARYANCGHKVFTI
ncbi:hypothetical protein Bca52824_037849 [Brassica carinata]|uniref:Myb/SANT-like domain-containing protein n=1 Tax=Brassica carinata TaxID=52824 RepID=A0A8X7UT54_BRACI|nr:hypothetical protein Bca52824_037849 [Brassica carinata]